MSNKKVAVILGSGPGIGVATGSLFASNGFDVALLSRNAERLDQDLARVRQANSNVKVQAYPVDLGDHNALALALGKVEDDFGPPEVVYYNAARVAPSKIGQTGADFVLEDFKVSFPHGIFTSISLSWLTTGIEHDPRSLGNNIMGITTSDRRSWKTRLSPIVSLHQQWFVGSSYSGLRVSVPAESRSVQSAVEL